MRITYTRLIVLDLLLLLLVMQLEARPQTKAVKRTYHPIAIADLAKEDPAAWKKIRGSHVAVEGWVTYTLVEGDGDKHIRLCDDVKIKTMDHAHCVVAEAVPDLQVTLVTQGQQDVKASSAVDWRLKIGQHVRVRGIVRYDAEHPGHHWWEVHPIESLEIIP